MSPGHVVPLLPGEIDAASVVKHRLQMNQSISLAFLLGVRPQSWVEEVFDDLCPLARARIRQFGKLLRVRMPDQQKRIAFRDVAERASRVPEVSALIVNLVLVRHLGNSRVTPVFNLYVATEHRTGSSQQDR